ncbi:hypothetical protein TWF281_004026 [Arthrobotrys megalospora]
MSGTNEASGLNIHYDLTSERMKALAYERSAKDYYWHDLMIAVAFSTFLEKAQNEPQKPPTLQLLKRQAKTKQDRLTNLPLEVLFQIMEYLDIQTIQALGYLNPLWKEIVSGNRSYKHILTVAPVLLYGLNYTDMASHFTLKQLTDILMEPSCFICGKFGNLVYLPRMSRCCPHCFLLKPELRTIAIVTTGKMYDLPRAWFEARTPCAHPPVSDSTEKITPNGIAISASRKRHLVNEAEAKRLARAHVPHENYIPNNDDYRHLVTVPVPVVDSDGTVHNGLFCKGCRYTDSVLSSSRRAPIRDKLDAHARRDMCFSNTTINAHISGCPEIQQALERCKADGADGRAGQYLDELDGPK